MAIARRTMRRRLPDGSASGAGLLVIWPPPCGPGDRVHRVSRDGRSGSPPTASPPACETPSSPGRLCRPTSGLRPLVPAQDLLALLEDLVGADAVDERDVVPAPALHLGPVADRAAHRVGHHHPV